MNREQDNERAQGSDAIDRSAINRDFGDGLSRAVEMVATPAIFAFLGFVIDRRLGVVPLFTMLFTLVVAGYILWRTFKVYDQDLEAETALAQERITARAERRAKRYRRG